MADERIVVSGGSGLIGRELIRSLRADGVHVVQLVRRPARDREDDGIEEREWRPGPADAPALDPDALAGAKAVVNLNGASIGRLPWTARYRTELRRSRIEPTAALAAAVRVLGADAPALVSASAVGVYGSRPGERLTEASGAGDGFLAGLCVEWEAAALAAGPDARVALLRTAPLLHPLGVLKPMVQLTRFGAAGPLGGGGQAWPWISLDDEVRGIRHVIDAGLSGPVNLSGPTTASANRIGRGLARSMHRPFWAPAPAWALRLALGRDTADALLLSDAAVEPEALLVSGFAFRHETPEAAIADALG